MTCDGIAGRCVQRQRADRNSDRARCDSVGADGWSAASAGGQGGHQRWHAGAELGETATDLVAASNFASTLPSAISRSQELIKPDIDVPAPTTNVRASMLCTPDRGSVSSCGDGGA